MDPFDEKIAKDSGIDMDKLKEFTSLTADLMKTMVDGFAAMIGADPNKVAGAMIFQARDDSGKGSPDFVQANCCLHCAANAMMAHHVDRLAAQNALTTHAGTDTKH